MFFFKKTLALVPLLRFLGVGL